MSQLPENSDLRALIQNQAKAEETVIEDIANIDKKITHPGGLYQSPPETEERSKLQACTA